MEVNFSSLNPYESLQVIVGDDPQDLVRRLASITTPMKIIAIVPFGTKQAAYIMGDLRAPQIKKAKSSNKSKEN